MRPPNDHEPAATRRRPTRGHLILSAAVALGALAGAYGLATWRARVVAEPHPYLRALPEPPQVLAHQGGDGLWPGNTLRAFEGAAALGADVLELDVHATADGRIAVVHDATVDRTTDASGPVAQFTAEELQALDASFAWSPPAATDPTFPHRGEGIGIPTLDQVFAAHPDMPINVEIKPDSAAVARQLCDLLRQVDRTATTLVASFHERSTRAFRSACPEVATAASPAEVRTFVVLSRLRLAGPYRPRFDALQVPERQGSIRVVTPSLLAAARAKGVAVHVWTVNAREEMDRLLAMGVDGLITDRPDRAMRAVGRTPNREALPGFARPAD